MIVLHDSPNSDLKRIQAMADIEEEFALFDYVRIRIEQSNKSWIGQVIEPNRNISTVGNPLDPTILHGLKLMQSGRDIQSVESVQVFEILILGEEVGSQRLTSRIRPLPGATVEKLDTETINRVIGIPQQAVHADGGSNVIGELLNADQVPLCIDARILNHHVMIAGGTGSGKSNVAANVIEQAMKFDKCVLVHDAKPDYGLIGSKNSDASVETVWERFHKYGLTPHSPADIRRVGFHGKCDSDRVDIVAGCRASDLAPAMLAGFFFPETSEQLQFEGFVRAADSIEQNPYSLDDILRVVTDRIGLNTADGIHSTTGQTILRKVESRRAEMSWLDVVGQTITGHGEKKVFNFNFQVDRGRILVIDYSQMDDSSYALLLSYVLQYCQSKRSSRTGVGIVQMVDEAHRIFDNESRHSDTLASLFNRIMREGRTFDHSVVLSLQNASQIPRLVMNNLNTNIVMRQNSRNEADYATQTMGRDFSVRALELGTGQALIKMFESQDVVPVQMAPSPFELMRSDNTGQNTNA
ncbi:ATP-binding protein [Candidatus Poribacteria bacterium]|nr:ATP-binding protein [Candidatus Poribacteria bacterium]